MKLNKNKGKVHSWRKTLKNTPNLDEYLTSRKLSIMSFSLSSISALNNFYKQTCLYHKKTV